MPVVIGEESRLLASYTDAANNVFFHAPSLFGRKRRFRIRNSRIGN